MRSLTIFTPTYNRKETIKRLYKSLCNQTCKDFMWLVVDDGSKDGTEDYIEECKHEGIIEIAYTYQENAGKSMAHNKGVELTKTPLFTCVDSDDYLADDAVETILDTDLTRKECIGVLFKKGFDDNTAITVMKNKVEYTTLYDAYHHYGLQGDTMLVYKSEIIKKHSFPYFEGEKFVPEAYLYDRLDQEGLLKIEDRILLFVDYLEDGYSHNIRRLIAHNPRGYCEYAIQRIKSENNIRFLIPDYIRYISVRMVIEKKDIITDLPNRLLGMACYIPGGIAYLYLYKKHIG